MKEAREVAEEIVGVGLNVVRITALIKTDRREVMEECAKELEKQGCSEVGCGSWTATLVPPHGPNCVINMAAAIRKLNEKLEEEYGN